MALTAAQQQLYNFYQSVPASARGEPGGIAASTPDSIMAHLATLSDSEALGTLAGLTGQNTGSNYRPESVSATIPYGYGVPGYSPNASLATNAQPSMGNPTPATVPYQQRTSNDQVQQWLAANPGATDSQIRSAMDANGVGVGQLAGVTGMNRADVQARYNAATSNVAPIAGGTTNSQITDWLARNPGATDAEIAQVANNYGVTPERLASATGGNAGEIRSRYEATQAPASISNGQITDWLSSNPGATDAQIAQAMQQYGVSPLQMSQATGVDYGSVLNRYNDATGTKAPIANSDVADWYSRNQGMDDAGIRQVMNNYGVSPDQLAASIGANPAGVQSRYDAAGAPPRPYVPPGSPPAPAVGSGSGTVPGGYPAGPIDQGTGGGPTSTPNPYLPAGSTPGQSGGGFGGTGSFGQYGGYGAFGTQSSPWMSGVADDIMRRTQDALGQSFNGIRSNAVGVGGLGGSRQGVAEGIATRGAMDSMQGNLANLFNSDYQQTQNRGLQAYNTDTNAYLGNQGQWMGFAQGLGGLANQRYGMDQNYSLGLGNQALTNQGQQMNFYGQQRGQDLQSIGLGADLYKAGIGGEWAPIQNAGNAYQPFTGFGTSTTSGQQGGGWQGGVGGALAGASLGRQMSWW